MFIHQAAALKSFWFCHFFKLCSFFQLRHHFAHVSEAVISSIFFWNSSPFAITSASLLQLELPHADRDIADTIRVASFSDFLKHF